ncbi:MAG: LacI family DNA-binding transcriptional regulator [Victivallaceae bacterium]
MNKIDNSKEIKPVTRKDVAKAAGVSLTTVTHALNPKPGTRVKGKTRDKIKRIADELKYKPNFIGRALVTGKSFNVGLLQPGYEAIFLNFYQRMSYGLVETMGKDDYNMLLVFRDGQANYLRTISQGRVDGMIVLQSDFGDADIKKVIERNIPLVILNRTFNPPYNNLTGCVVSDHALLAEEIFKEFLAKGCKNIVAINDPRSCDPNYRVFEAFTRISEEIIKDGISANTTIPSKENFSIQINNLFKSGQRWDGIYVDGEELMLTLVKSAAQFGLKPGRDFSLILSSVLKHVPEDFDFPVTVYLQQPEIMGAEAWKMLRSIICQEKIEKMVKVPYKKMI